MHHKVNIKLVYIELLQGEMKVCIVLVSIIIINKNSLYPQGKDLEKVVTTRQWHPLAKSALGLQVL